MVCSSRREVVYVRLKKNGKELYHSPASGYGFETAGNDLYSEREQRSELGRNYNRGANIIRSIDTILDVAAIGLNITGVELLPTIVAASATIGIDLVAIVVGIIKVIGNHVKKTCSLKMEKHKNIDMLASTTFNTITALILSK